LGGGGGGGGGGGVGGGGGRGGGGGGGGGGGKVKGNVATMRGPPAVKTRLFPPVGKGGPKKTLGGSPFLGGTIKWRGVFIKMRDTNGRTHGDGSSRKGP